MGLEPGSMASSLGPTPGAGASPFGAAPGLDAPILSGRAGTAFPRVPTSVTTPGGVMGPAPRLGITAPAPLAVTEVPLYGPLEVPDVAEAEGPADGLTLDQAVERLIADNLVLRSASVHIPKARADVLTASLRPNPILYADGQLVPYGQYSRKRPGGPTQYDLNVSHPLDLSRKRQARTAAAEAAATVLEAQFQDVVRTQVDNLYTAYVDVLSARETLRYARASIEGLKRVARATEALYKRANATRADVGRVRILQQRADLGQLQAEESLRRSKRTLARFLNLPPADAERLELRGTIADLAPTPPPPDELVRLALASRPDLAAARLGVGRSEAYVALARANRFADAYLLYQPYTFQNNAPFGTKSATSWAVGATVALPVFNRNQGGVLRARLNVEQTQTELAAAELAVALEVVRAEREYQVSRAATQRLGRDVVPAARLMRDDTLELFVRGELDALASYNAQRGYNDVVRAYRDAAVRHRRSMLRLNTAVGQRILP
jgi:cobalt-zinc-cadmium efflux system outer membrane protein